MKSTFRITGVVVVALLFMATTFRSDNNKYFEITKNIEIFTNLYKELNTYYVDDLDPGKLMRTGIDAMVGSLDPYTNYISEADIEGYRYLTEGRYNGIGAVSKKVGEYVTITELYKDQPADKAGLKVGDRIIAVDGNDATNRDPEAINNILRGFPGTSVDITVQRPGLEKPFDLTLQRDEVSVANVPYQGMVDEKVGYVALTTFTRDAGRNVANAIRELKEENPDMEGLIFDLRDNGGGLLSEAVNICNIFIPKNELVVTTKGKVKDWDREFKTLNNSLDTEIPLVILIDNYSASASEIVCGVIQDYDRGVLVGQRSYGKGLVQNTRDVGYNAKVKMTTAKYYIPSGRCIQSVEYDDGEPVHIDDAQRTPFKTRNGRTVLDGGGVKPDLVLSKASDVAIIKSLIQQDLIFEYVTNYVLTEDVPAHVEDFHFEDFDEFVAFLEERNFNYETESERLLNRLETTADKEGYTIDDQLVDLRGHLKTDKETALREYRDDIIDLIEKEIASRYFYQEGKIKMGLRNDKEIEEAIAVLQDQKRYSDILAGKE